MVIDYRKQLSLREGNTATIHLLWLASGGSDTWVVERRRALGLGGGFVLELGATRKIAGLLFI